MDAMREGTGAEGGGRRGGQKGGGRRGGQKGGAEGGGRRGGSRRGGRSRAVLTSCCSAFTKSLLAEDPSGIDAKSFSRTRVALRSAWTS
jgi:hypothetical protein